MAEMMYMDGKEVSASEYYAETDLKTMIEAEKIKMDPKRLKACMARKKKLYYALQSIMGKGMMGKSKMGKAKMDKDMNYGYGAGKSKKKSMGGSSHAY